MRRFLCRGAPLLLALGLAVLHPPPLGGQEPADETGPAAGPRPIGAAEVAERSRTIADSAAATERELERLADVSGLRADLAAAESRQRELLAMLGTLGTVEHTRPERIVRLRDEALAQEGRLEQIAGRIEARMADLSTLRGEWVGRLEVWSALRSAAPERPELAAQRVEIEAAIGRIEPLLERLREVEAVPAQLAAEAGRLRAGNQRLQERIAAIRAGRREALLRADQPMLLSRGHLAALSEPSAWRPAEAVPPAAIVAFGREHAGLLVLHLVLVVVVGLVVRRVHPHVEPEDGWAGLTAHPWAVAIFAVTTLLGRRYLLAPPLWDVVEWGLLAGSAAVLAWTLLRGWALRAMVVSVAVVYPLVLLAEALRIPTPVFRLGIAGAALAALIGFPLMALRSAPETPRGRRARLVLGAAAALSAAVLLAQVLGFDGLSRWLVHAILTSAYVAFAVIFLLIIARGALGTLLRKEFVGRARIIGAVAVPLASRLVTILQVALVIVGVFLLLDVWELAPAPLETWNRIIDWGFEIAGLRITVERLLVAALLVYLALVASWLARTVVTTEISRGWGFERGVAESINSLVHYFLITLGVLFGLGALGVELQNFAIVAGALGVGIGFGLQNVVNNFVSGLILLFERPVRVGDTVEIGGEWGTIKKIGLRSTVVVTFSQSEMIVPNGDLVSEKVTNWTLTNPVTRLAIPIGVAYGSDVQRVLKILVEATGAHLSVVPQPAPIALFTGFGDSSLDFELRFWVREIPDRLIAKSAVLAEIDRRFREEGIEIPFPQRDLHIRSVDSVAAGALTQRAPAPGATGAARLPRTGSTGDASPEQGVEPA